MLFMVQNKDKDLLGIYQYGCDPFCVSLLLVFSKCFRAGYFTFSQLKFKVNKGINL